MLMVSKRLKGIKDIDSWSERMKKPFLDLYGEEYFRKHWALWVEAFGKYYTQRKGDVCIEDCPRIKCPTLIIHGEKDPIVPREHPEYLLANIKNSRFYSMPEGKHNLNLRYPEEFKKVVEGFLNE